MIVVAGSSAGRDDYTAAVVERPARCRPRRRREARPPGRARRVDATPVIGAPGYPVSAALTFELFALPLLAALEGTAPPAARGRGRGWRAGSPRRSAPTTGCACGSAVSAAELVATPLPRGAGVLTSLVRADGLLVVPAALEGHDAGEEVEVRLVRELDAVERTIVALGSHDLVLDLAASLLRAPTRCDARVARSARSAGWWRCATGSATWLARTCSTPRPAPTRCRGWGACSATARWRSSASCTASRG